MSPALSRATHAVSLEPIRNLFLAQRPDLAERELRQWLSLNPHDSRAWSMLGWALALLGRAPEAVEAAEQGVRHAGDLAYAHLVLGEVHLRLNHAAQAEQSLRVALQLAPNDPYTHAILAYALLARRLPWRWPEALRVAEAGLALDPGHAECARARTVALIRHLRFRRAREAAEYALALEPENAQGIALAGWINLHGRDWRKGRDQLREALRLDPQNPATEHALWYAERHLRLSIAMVLGIERSRILVRFAAAFYVWIMLFGTILIALTPGVPRLTPQLLSVSLFFLLCIEAFTLRARLTRYGRERLGDFRSAGGIARGEYRDTRFLLVILLALATLFALGAFGSAQPPEGGEARVTRLP